MYVPAENAGLTLRESRAGITRITRGRGLADYAEGDDGLGKLKISFKHPFGKKSIFGKTVRVVGKVAKVAVPIVAGGALLKFGVPVLKKGISSLLSRKAKPSTTTVTAAGPVVTPAVDASASSPSVADTVADTAVNLLKSTVAAKADYAVPGASPDDQSAAVTDNVQQAGMMGAGGLDSKTLLILGAVGAGALLLSKRR
jgi:hypothetical protein